MACDIAYTELAAFVAGEVAAERSSQIAEHSEQCQLCRTRLDALKKVDATLLVMTKITPPGQAELTVRRALVREIHSASMVEIMTLDEVAQFLRISADDLEEIVGELPAFELAGHIRVRRAKLIEWLERREGQYMRSTRESDVAGVFIRGVA